MEMQQRKELIIAIIFSIINISIAYLITNLLGISNTIIVKTYSTFYGDVTFESIIFMLLSLVCATIYDYKQNKENENAI